MRNCPPLNSQFLQNDNPWSYFIYLKTCSCTMYLQHSNIYKFTFLKYTLSSHKHWGNKVSGTWASPKYLLPFCSFCFRGNQNPWKGWYHPSSDLTLYFYLDSYSTWVYIKLLHHIWILVVLMESPQHSGPPSQHCYLTALSRVHGAPSRFPSLKEC